MSRVFLSGATVGGYLLFDAHLLFLNPYFFRNVSKTAQRYYKNGICVNLLLLLFIKKHKKFLLGAGWGVLRCGSRAICVFHVDSTTSLVFVRMPSSTPASMMYSLASYCVLLPGFPQNCQSISAKQQ
jgi:hypothetical protein